MKSTTLTILAALLLVMFIASCAAPTATTAPPAVELPPDSLILVTHDSFDIGEEVIAGFTAETGIEIQILKSGDAGEMLNTLMLSKENPLGDVVYGIDNSFLSRALTADLFTAYESPELANIPGDLKLDTTHRLLPVDFGFVTLNYDVGWFEEKGIQPPQDITDLVDPIYEGLTVVQNPASSSPGLAFLLVTVGRFGVEGDYTYLDYWRELRENGVLVADGWSEAYWGAFTVGSAGEGDRPIVVSYATSPSAEIYYNELTAPPSLSLNSAGNSFEQVEFVGILKNSPHQAAARQLIDYLLGRTFQEDIPLHMFVYPTNNQADMGDLFRQWADIPTDPVEVDPVEIARGRETWIEDWTDVMLR